MKKLIFLLIAFLLTVTYPVVSQEIGDPIIDYNMPDVLPNVGEHIQVQANWPVVQSPAIHMEAQAIEVQAQGVIYSYDDPVYFNIHTLIYSHMVPMGHVFCDQFIIQALVNKQKEFEDTDWLREE